MFRFFFPNIFSHFSDGIPKPDLLVVIFLGENLSPFLIFFLATIYFLINLRLISSPL